MALRTGHTALASLESRSCRQTSCPPSTRPRRPRILRSVPIGEQHLGAQFSLGHRFVDDLPIEPSVDDEDCN